MRSLQPTKSSLCWVTLFLVLSVVSNAAGLVWNGAGTDTRWALQCDFIGRDVKNQISTGDQCGSLCKANPPCSHFTWTNYKVQISLPLKIYLSAMNTMANVTKKIGVLPW